MDFVTQINEPLYFPQTLQASDFKQIITLQTGVKKYWRKVPSYMPPEFVEVDSQRNQVLLLGCLADRWDHDVDKQWRRWESELRREELDICIYVQQESLAISFVADTSFDLWQLGCLMYHCIQGRKLMAVDHLSNPTACVTTDGGEGDICNLFDLCTWDVVRNMQFGECFASLVPLYELMTDLLRQDPKDRKLFDGSGADGSKGNSQTTSLQRLEEHLYANGDITFQIEVSSNTSLVVVENQKKKEIGGRTGFFDTESTASASIDQKENHHRRSYYLPALEGATQAKIELILDILGRISCLYKTSDKDLDFVNKDHAESGDVIRL